MHFSQLTFSSLPAIHAFIAIPALSLHSESVVSATAYDFRWNAPHADRLFSRAQQAWRNRTSNLLGGVSSQKQEEATPWFTALLPFTHK